VASAPPSCATSCEHITDRTDGTSGCLVGSGSISC
jgi:hypothetical protein